MEILVPSFTDIIDILIIAAILYRFILMLKKAGGYQILFGLIVAVVIFFVATMLELHMVTSLLGIIKDNWVILIVILFQQEIRTLFAKAAQSHDLKSLFTSAKKSVHSPLLNAVSIMSFRRIGALIVIENKRNLNDYIESGELIDSRISVKLLLTVFNNRSILHDGAAIIRDDRILSVKVVLPLSENVEYTQKVGTRHLAAIGITENTDALAVVVSEETGKISIAKGGELITDLSIDELSQRIKDETS